MNGITEIASGILQGAPGPAIAAPSQRFQHVLRQPQQPLATTVKPRSSACTYECLKFRYSLLRSHSLVACPWSAEGERQR